MKHMSPNTQHFHCLGADCPNHCCGAYAGFSPHLQNAGAVLFSEIILLPEDQERMRKAGFAHLIVQKSNGISCIRTAEDGTCAALCNGKCSVYDCRPSICRAYPLYLDMYTGVCVQKECPGVNQETIPEDLPENLNSLLKIYQFWIDRYTK